jgi:hypothetical protein
LKVGVSTVSFAGLSFASAIAWLDVARWIIAMIVQVPKTSGAYVLLSALLITALSMILTACPTR